MKNLCFLFFAVFLFGCATARVVTVEHGVGGEIAVNPLNSDEARGKAQDLMRQNCGGKNFKVVKEGEAVVGSRSESYGNSRNYKGGFQAGSGVTVSKDKTEWRLTYKCQ